MKKDQQTALWVGAGITLGAFIYNYYYSPQKVAASIPVRDNSKDIRYLDKYP